MTHHISACVSIASGISAMLLGIVKLNSVLVFSLGTVGLFIGLLQIIP